MFSCSTIMWTIFLFFNVSLLMTLNYVESHQPRNLCPEPEDVAPCVCEFPSYYLLCKNVQDVADLKRVAVNLEGHQVEFAQVRIVNSSLQYLPREILELVKVTELYIENVTLVKVFEEPPTSVEQFRIIRFHNVNLLRGVIWAVFKSMSNLQILEINDIRIATLGEEFSQNVPHQLEKLELENTGLKKFATGAFKDFKSLTKIDIYKCKLSELKRDSFPVPFDVQALYFSYNKLKSIPADLFTQMPKLMDISLAGNQLAYIPESAFGGRYGELNNLYLRENPIKCDCSIKWLLRSKPFWFDGTCASPKVMHGKELKSLTEWDIHC